MLICIADKTSEELLAAAPMSEPPSVKIGILQFSSFWEVEKYGSRMYCTVGTKCALMARSKQNNKVMKMTGCLLVENSR